MKYREFKKKMEGKQKFKYVSKFCVNASEEELIFFFFWINMVWIILNYGIQRAFEGRRIIDKSK